ncbi:MAG TPA: TadE/TadG family type IV pilus assembly protein [Allosphingosinicella sp.]
MLKRLIRRDQRGAGAVEFALVLPALLAFIIGTAQMGKLFFANADMRHAVAAGARVASVFPVPDDATILAKVNEKITRAGAAGRTTAIINHSGEDEANPWIEIQMTYTVPLDFVFFNMAPVTLSETRRVYTQVTETSPTEEEEEEEETPTTSGGTSSDGGTPTTSGGTSSDGGTPTTSGGTSSDGGTPTTSGGTSSDGGTTTPGSSNNASSGGSKGHGHGTCKKGGC